MKALGQADYGQVFISDTDNARIPALLSQAGVEHAHWWVGGEGVTPLHAEDKAEAT